MRRLARIAPGFAGGMLMVAGACTADPTVRFWEHQVRQWVIVLVAAAALLGIANLLRVHLGAISRRETDWPYRAVLLLCLAGMLLLGMAHPLELQSNDTGPNTTFSWVFEAAYVPLQSSLFALLAFCLASAAWRALRASTLDTALLCGSAVLGMAGRLPLASWLGLDRIAGGAHRLDLAAAQAWVMAVPVTAARRALVIGAALGAIALGARVLLGLSRPRPGGE